MRIRLTLRPEQDGAKELRKQYGDRLLCVRYRYDEERKKRYKTVELIIAEHDWEPPMEPRSDTACVWVRISARELEMRQKIKAAGGQWDPQRRLWEVRHDQVVALGLAERIVQHAPLYM
ncbi:MAG: hypothetical protein HY267_00395 [Deltaproteobacteria bacterium]|nr:hypothetical protein [Deltaproteobacteria bacterium]